MKRRRLTEDNRRNTADDHAAATVILSAAKNPDSAARGSNESGCFAPFSMTSRANAPCKGGVAPAGQGPGLDVSSELGTQNSELYPSAVSRQSSILSAFRDLLRGLFPLPTADAPPDCDYAAALEERYSRPRRCC